MKRFVKVHYHLKPGMRDEFYQAVIAHGIADASRAEEGNEKYGKGSAQHGDHESLQHAQGGAGGQYLLCSPGMDPD